MGDGNEQSSKELTRSSSFTSRSSPRGNAEGGAGMKFASMDALSELVWSPRNGLSLRCADFSFTGKAKLHSPNFFDIGQNQTNMALHSKRISIDEEEEAAGFRVDVQLRTRDLMMMDTTEEEVNQACSRMSNEINRPLSGIVGGSVEEMKPEREEVIEDKVETNDDSKEAETRVGSSKRSLDSPRAKAIQGETGALLRLESAGSQEEPAKEGFKRNNRDRLESTDENDLASKALVACESKGECLPDDEAGPSGSYKRRAKAKGKEKAFSDGNFDQRRSNNADNDNDNDNDDESFGSVESCNSAGLLSRGKKRPPGFEQQLILRSKRLKTLSQECLGSTSKLKQDSSFMNWISNMTKGIWKGNEEDDSPFVALTATTSNANVAIADQQQLSPCCMKENSGCRNTGFQSFFKSIYCPRKRSEDDDANAEPPRFPEQCLITNGEHLSLSSGHEIAPVAVSSGKAGVNKASEEALSSENKLTYREPNEEQKTCGEAADGKKTLCLTNRNGAGFESLWISRFSSKSSFPQKKDLHRITSEATMEDSAYFQKQLKANESISDGIKTQKLLTDNRFDDPKPKPIVSSLRIESSEAMASLFARTLETLKHVMPSSSLGENIEEGQTNLICFYCGKKGHLLRDCLEVTDTELRDLLQNISARNVREEASSLCIRCFQLSHWAATCPNAPPYSSGAEDRATKHAFASTSGTKLPLSDFTKKQVTDVPKAVFDAVQLLRLTRTDVIKWMNTKKSVSGLKGFFLRLRLGKWEEGIGGTGYYVARIDGGIERQESSRRHSENSSISVKVGGMSCFVESQFISNHDFLEEELKAWWRSAGESAGRSGSNGDGIPSAEELSRKIQQRKMLGV